MPEKRTFPREQDVAEKYISRLPLGIPTGSVETEMLRLNVFFATIVELITEHGGVALDEWVGTFCLTKTAQGDITFPYKHGAPLKFKDVRRRRITLTMSKHTRDAIKILCQ